MALGVRTKLLVVSVAILAALGLGTELILEAQVRGLVASRAGESAPDTAELVWAVRRVFAGAAVVGVGVALFMSALASQLLSRTLAALVENARALARGKPLAGLAPSDSGELGGIVRSFQRLSDDLEQTVSTLAGERNRFEATLESMTEAVVALDLEDRVALVNSAALTMLRLSAPPIGRAWVEVTRSPPLHELVAAARRGESSPTELDVHGPKPLRIRARATRLVPSGGVVVVMHDVTELRRLETIRRDFIANVSHELRTPVSIIRANVETLQSGALDNPEHARRFLDALGRSAERLTNLVNDLLDISRIEAGRYQIDARVLDAQDVLTRAADVFRIGVEQKQLALAVESPPGIAVYADPRALDQVLMNLIENAVKYTPAGGHLTVRARTVDPATTRLEVVDDGPGIEPKHRARVFERFYRVDAGRSREMGGTGLGLAIVKHLSEAMRGHVGCDAAPTRGSVFWVELPSKPSPAAEVAAAGDA